MNHEQYLKISSQLVKHVHLKILKFPKSIKIDFKGRTIVIVDFLVRIIPHFLNFMEFIDLSHIIRLVFVMVMSFQNHYLHKRNSLR